MQKRLLVALTMGLLSLPAQAEPPVLSALFSLTVMDKGVERKVDPKETLPAGSRVLVHVEAQHQPCTIVASGYQEGKTQEIPAVPPMLFSLKSAEQASGEFRLSQPLKASEFFVVVLPQHAGVTREVTQLVSNWKARPESGQARVALHERLTGWISKQDKEVALPFPSSRSLTVGGDLPSEAYDWHNEADGLRYLKDRPGVFVYHIGKR